MVIRGTQRHTLTVWVFYWSKQGGQKVHITQYLIDLYAHIYLNRAEEARLMVLINDCVHHV